uniref:Uncharacterized protein n=1 Tax=Arundo donax TaxID=35708 RepID=A0A0A9D8C1_ARUDO
MAMFCAFLGSSTLFSCRNGGTAAFLPASLGGAAGVELFMNKASIMSSSSWNELDLSWSQTMARSEVARTLSQCSGFSFGRGSPLPA